MGLDRFSQENAELNTYMISKYSFYNQVQTLLRPNRFEVIIAGSKLFKLPYFEMFDVDDGLVTQVRLPLTCEVSELPGKSFSTTSVKHGREIYEYPYNTVYPEVGLSFIVGGDLIEKKFFDAWMFSIQDPNNHNMAYINEYAVDVHIRQLNENDEIIYTCTLLQAYPKAMESIPLSYMDTNTASKLKIRLVYRTWTSQFLGLPASDTEEVVRNLDEININGTLFNQIRPKLRAEKETV